MTKKTLSQPKCKFIWTRPFGIPQLAYQTRMKVKPHMSHSVIDPFEGVGQELGYLVRTDHDGALCDKDGNYIEVKVK